MKEKALAVWENNKTLIIVSVAALALAYIASKAGASDTGETKRSRRNAA